MIEFIVGAVILLTTIFSVLQLAFLWAGQGAVETAAHFASRKFAFQAREDLGRAKASALSEASLHCRNRPGGSWGTAALTSLEFSRNGDDSAATRAFPGEAYQVRLTHGIELIVPWIDRILFLATPVPKIQLGEKYYLLLHATRWVTVE